MAQVRQRWLGPDAGDRYRSLLLLLLGLLGGPAVVYGLVVTIDDWTVAGPLIVVTTIVTVVVVTRRGRQQAWTPAVSAATLAVLVAFTGGSESHLATAYLLTALGSAFLHDSRWFAVNLLWIATLGLAPLVYDPPTGRPVDTDQVLITAAVMLAAVVVVHVLSEVLRARNRRLTALLREQEVANEQLREAQEAKDVFLSALSHELRTPLTAVVGLGETLQAHGEQLTAAQRGDMVGRLIANGHRLQRLLTDLLDLRRLQQGATDLALDVVHLPDLVARALEDVATEQHELHLEVPEVAASLDAAKVERIVANLVANACKHTPPGSRIWVRMTVGEGTVALVVEDDGPGVPDALKAGVFEVFRQGPHSRTDPSPGTGVGLSIVERFARLHGGEARVEDRPGGGARFHVDLVADRSRHAVGAGPGPSTDPGSAPRGPDIPA